LHENKARVTNNLASLILSLPQERKSTVREEALPREVKG
jgi:hypothetical protein